MLFQTSYNRGWEWKVHCLVDDSDEFRESLGEEVLALVGGRVKTKGEMQAYVTVNPDDAVKEYILERLHVRNGVGVSDVKVIVVELNAIALAEFEVLDPNGLHKGYYQASVVVGKGLD